MPRHQRSMESNDLGRDVMDSQSSFGGPGAPPPAPLPPRSMRTVTYLPTDGQVSMVSQLPMASRKARDEAREEELQAQSEGRKKDAEANIAGLQKIQEHHESEVRKVREYHIREMEVLKERLHGLEGQFTLVKKEHQCRMAEMDSGFEETLNVMRSGLERVAEEASRDRAELEAKCANLSQQIRAANKARYGKQSTV
eukprot:Selendium_serpulae@DN2772_c0_g1_i2.p1